MEWLYVIIGIACLIVLQSLRGALSFEYPVYTSRPIRPPDQTRFGGLDLIDVKSAALNALGFEGPAWVGDDSPAESSSVVTAHAVYRHRGDHIVAWVGPTIDLEHPEQLLTYYTTLLADGRYAVTQVSDPYFELADDPKTPAQTIGASGEAAEIEKHKQFVASLGSPPANATPREDVLQFASDQMNGIRARLLERGRITESNGIARPSLRHAFDMLRKFHSRPKPADSDATTVPTSRLAFLAEMVERAGERAPSQGTQWLLLFISALLFVGIGWPLLGLEFTLVILGVIVFHEAGHWVAMRLFGYKNPHITLLPLLGGVTIGHETDPSAGKRAWVALAGPLPGIVLGWILVYYLGFIVTDIFVGGNWVFAAIAALLFVNYLNVLPIPPLDGSHIVQAILPPRWIWLQTLLIFVGVAIGVYVAYLLDFWPIALIAGLQLLGIKSLWRTGGLVRRFSQAPPPADLDKQARRVWLLAELESLLGAPKAAVKRIGLANEILNRLDTQPMGFVHRTTVSGIYLGLVAVPVAALGLALLDPFALSSSPEVEAMYEQYDAEYDAAVVAVANLDDVTLLKAIAEPGAVPAPATDEALRAAEARLGRTLPAHLRDFYLLSNGLPEQLGVSGIEDIRPIDPETFRSGDLMYSAYEGQLYFYSEELGDVVVPISATAGWWQIGVTDDLFSIVFVDPDARPGQAAVFSFTEDDYGAFETMRGLLESAWLGQRSMEIYEDHSERLRSQIEASMAGLTVEEMIEEFPDPSLFQRVLSRNFSEPGPASAEALAAAEARIGHKLPADYRAVLEIHNGFSPMQLLPIEEIQPAGNAAEFNFSQALEIANEVEPDAFTDEDIKRCWAIAGHNRRSTDDHIPPEVYASLFWCPDLEPEHRYISFGAPGFRASFTDVVRDHAVLMRSY